MTSQQTTCSAAGRVVAAPAADSAAAVAHYGRRLAFETDVSDVAADLAVGVAGLVVLDVRSSTAWQQGHVAGAVHCPTDEIPDRVGELVPAGATVVAYCWGPACNGATRAALALARLGYPVKEMLGGYEYWVREGLPVTQPEVGTRRRPVDPLTGVVDDGCGC